MKRVITSLFFVCCLTLCLSVFGEVFNGPTNLTLKIYDTLTIHGPAHLKLVKAKEFEISGPLEFHRLAIEGKAVVAGTMKGDNGKFGQLSVTGTMDVDHVVCDELTVKGPVKATYLDVHNRADIEGALEVQHGKFKTLSVTSDNIVLDDVVVESIAVGKSQNLQTLILKGETVVNGDIVFASGNGVVQTEGSQVRIIGKVEGGTLKK